MDQQSCNRYPGVPCHKPLRLPMHSMLYPRGVFMQIGRVSLSHVCACVCMCVCMCVYAFMHVCACVCMCVYACVCVCVCMHVCACRFRSPLLQTFLAAPDTTSMYWYDWHHQHYPRYHHHHPPSPCPITIPLHHSPSSPPTHHDPTPLCLTCNNGNSLINDNRFDLTKHLIG